MSDGYIFISARPSGKKIVDTATPPKADFGRRCIFVSSPNVFSQCTLRGVKIKNKKGGEINDGWKNTRAF